MQLALELLGQILISGQAQSDSNSIFLKELLEGVDNSDKLVESSLSRTEFRKPDGTKARARTYFFWVAYFFGLGKGGFMRMEASLRQGGDRVVTRWRGELRRK